MIERYLDTAADCVNSFAACVDASVQGEPLEQLVEKVERTHRAESLADDLRREITLLLYGKALFPESRGDILGLLEAVDRVPNQAENVVRLMRHQRFQMPSDYGDRVRLLADRVRACSLELIEAVRTLFSDHLSVIELADRVNELESEADEAEYALIGDIFSSSRETADKILLRDMVQAIGGIADRAEDASDRLRIIAVKRKV